jgi:Mn-dependent DtxR family transcriptional regulator
VDSLGQTFLRIAYEKNRVAVNGIAISKQMGLSHGDYISMLERLHRDGYVYTPGGNAKDVVLTEKGMRQAKSTAPR